MGVILTIQLESLRREWLCCPDGHANYWKNHQVHSIERPKQCEGASDVQGCSWSLLREMRVKFLRRCVAWAFY